ncbi:unnamed protein product, partial [Choristocarpus tenellus]
LRCCTVLQHPCTLFHSEPIGEGNLRILAASYGHPKDARLAVDIRAKIQKRVDDHGVFGHLDVDIMEDLTAWFGNPCPGVRKMLRIRYMPLNEQGKGLRREIWCQEEESKEGHLMESLLLREPKAHPSVLVFSASYGSPAGSFNGQGTFDVTELMQGRVDLAGGEYLLISREESLVDLFGDPCPGRIKELSIHYEILGTEGRVDALESDNHLLTPVNISSTPILAPLIIVQSATYGQTREGMDRHTKAVQKELNDLLSLQNRKDIGMVLTRDEIKRLHRIRPLIDDLNCLNVMQPLHYDVSAKVQHIIEAMGGGTLELVASREDLNGLFGNPSPGQKKELRIKHLVVGHDCEQKTSLEEVTTNGYQRNFILQQKGEVVVQQGGESLQISCQDSLSDLFEDPCRGVRKKLKISYIAR